LNGVIPMHIELSRQVGSLGTHFRKKRSNFRPTPNGWDKLPQTFSLIVTTDREIAHEHISKELQETNFKRSSSTVSIRSFSSIDAFTVQRTYSDIPRVHGVACCPNDILNVHSEIHSPKDIFYIHREAHHPKDVLSIHRRTKRPKMQSRVYRRTQNPKSFLLSKEEIVQKCWENDLESYGTEGHAVNIPLMFKGQNYDYWKQRMMAFFDACHINMWEVVENDNYIPNIKEGAEIP
ncbi:hypothetical protein CR513_03291, partial [Mucuna pruriens]